MPLRFYRHIILSILLTGTFVFSFGQTCKIGDVLINRNDKSRGVVFWVNPERTGGWMLAMKSMPGKNLADIVPIDNLPVSPYAAIKDTAGYSNTVKLRSICKPGDYNVLQIDIEHGWYIPAYGQLWHLLSVTDIINPVLVAHGGEIVSEDFDDMYSAFVSSSPGKAYAYIFILDFSIQSSTISSLRRTRGSSQRAVRTFNMSDILIDTTLAYQWNTGATTPQINDQPSSTTTYTVKATTTDGCPAEASGQVFVTNTPQIEIYDTIRKGETYTKNGFNVNGTGTYSRTIDNNSGCSTELILHLTVLEPLAPTVFDEVICEGQVYNEHHFTAWESGTYTQQWTTADGRDSMVILNLTVHPVYNKQIEATICQGERYNDNGFDETETGTYFLPLTSQEGCDSIITLKLNVTPLYLFPEEKTICFGETYDFRGRRLNESGIYYDSLKTVTGCDSIYQLKLNIRPELTKHIEATICQGERYTENGFDETETGTYFLPLTSQEGCDSTITLHLNVTPLYLSSEEKTICFGENYDFRGRILNESGIYYDSLKTVTGCDSIYQLKLNIRPGLTRHIEATICQGERYTENGFDKTEAGTYNLPLTSQEGCDSTITLHLNVTPLYLFSEEKTICFGETHNFRGRTLNESGIYYDSLKTVTGCDSIYQLKLNIRPELTRHIEATICQGERYTENGFDQTETGTYNLPLTSQEGCDSTITLHLNVTPLYLFSEEKTICFGETYNFRGRTLNESGIYYDSLKTVTGCDSIYQLKLNIRPEFTRHIEATICQGERYTDNGFDETETGTYFLPLTSHEGCDSTITLKLNVTPLYLFPEEQTICFGETYDFRGRTLNESGIYYDSLKTVTGCDSIYQLKLNIRPDLTRHIEATICQGERYTENGFNETEAGTFSQHLTSQEGCDSTVTLQLSVVSRIEGLIQIELQECSTHTYRFKLLSDNTTNETAYYWEFADQEDSDINIPMHSYADSGQYMVKLTLNKEQDCQTVITHLLKVPFYAQDINIYSDRLTVSIDNPEIKLWTDTLPNTSYRWEMGDGTSMEGAKVSHSYKLDTEGYYTVRLTAINSDNCRTEQSERIEITHPFIIPNTFTPNGDGINDVFMPGYKTKVIDRNGKVVYNGDEGWDGNYKGSKAPEDAYFYVIYLTKDNKTKEITGYIHLIR